MSAALLSRRYDLPSKHRPQHRTRDPDAVSPAHVVETTIVARLSPYARQCRTARTARFLRLGTIAHASMRRETFPVPGRPRLHHSPEAAEGTSAPPADADPPGH